MKRFRSHLVLLRLLPMLWLPFCCCQWQGVTAAWAADDSSIAVSCGSACCQRTTPSDAPSPEVPDGEDRCGVECCIRGEVPPAAWEPPIDRIGVELTPAATRIDESAPRGRILAKAHAPPIDAGPPRELPVGAHIRIQV